MSKKCNEEAGPPLIAEILSKCDAPASGVLTDWGRRIVSEETAALQAEVEKAKRDRDEWKEAQIKLIVKENATDNRCYDLEQKVKQLEADNQRMREALVSITLDKGESTTAYALRCNLTANKALEHKEQEGRR